MARSRGTRIWLVLVLATVVVWLVADSQGPDLLAFNAHGTWLHVLEVAWACSVIAFVMLMVYGVIALIRSQRR
jgi:hypothetical protein